jgi:hypothetical protein
VAGASSNAQAEGRTPVWVDESAFYLLPAAVRTDAPVGETPVLHVPLSRDHLSAISAITRTAGSCWRCSRSPSAARMWCAS